MNKFETPNYNDETTINDYNKLREQGDVAIVFSYIISDVKNKRDINNIFFSCISEIYQVIINDIDLALRLFKKLPESSQDFLSELNEKLHFEPDVSIKSMLTLKLITK